MQKGTKKVAVLQISPFSMSSENEKVIKIKISYSTMHQLSIHQIGSANVSDHKRVSIIWQLECVFG